MDDRTIQITKRNYDNISSKFWNFAILVLIKRVLFYRYPNQVCALMESVTYRSGFIELEFREDVCIRRSLIVVTPH